MQQGFERGCHSLCKFFVGSHSVQALQDVAIYHLPLKILALCKCKSPIPCDSPFASIFLPILYFFTCSFCVFLLPCLIRSFHAFQLILPIYFTFKIILYDNSFFLELRTNIQICVKHYKVMQIFIELKLLKNIH